MRPLLLGAAVALALLLAAPAVARADRVEQLTTSLLTDPSWRVRVQAAITLGKLKARERRAVQALKEALKDDNDGVRAVAAETLGRLGDAGAKEALKALLSDASPTVAAEARKAIDLIDHPAPEEPAAGASAAPGGGGGGPARWYLQVSGFASKVAAADLVTRVHDRALKALGGVPGLTLDPAAAAPRGRYYLDGNIVTLAVSPPDGNGRVKTECAVSITLATLPDKSIKMFGSCGGVVGGTAEPKDLEGARNDCLADAAKQIAEKVQAFLEAH